MSTAISKEQIKTVIKDAMQEYYSDRGILTPTTIDVGRAFAYFYINEIFANKYNISEVEITDGLNIDGKGDLGADCIFIKDNNYLIFQFKYKGKNNSVDKDEVAGFRELHEKLTNSEHVTKYGNNEVKYVLSNFSEKSNVIYFFITNDEMREDLKDRKTSSDNVELQYIDLPELWIEYKNVVSQSNGVPETIRIPVQKIDDTRNAFMDITKLTSAGTKYETAIVVLKGTHLRDLYEFKNYRDSLFSYNIRGYLGEKPVNKKIRQTILEQPEHFYYLNNGISAICTSYELKQEAKHSFFIECTDFQIINGAQTVSTIAKIPKEQYDKLDKVQVIMRLTKTEDIKTYKRGLNRDIITANNNQTAIKVSDFRSNDEIQTFLENELPKYAYRASSPYQVICYQPKRKYFKKKKSENLFVIQMDTLAKILHSFYFDPTSFQSKPSILFDADSQDEGLYWKVFGVNDEEVAFYEKSKITETAAVIILWIHLQNISDEIKKTSDNESRKYQATLAKWQIIYALGLIAKRFNSEEKKRLYKHIIEGKVLDKGGVVANWVSIVIEIIEDLLDDEYTANEEENRAFNLRNWLRKKELTQKIEKRINRKTEKFLLP